MLEEWDRFIAECRSLSGVKVGTLKIGASTVPASYLLPRIVKRLREHYPIWNYPLWKAIHLRF